jgi:formamidopyrimidine-DNA glycosylase
MPELPEVETIARDIRPHVTGRRITRARVIKPDILRKAGRREFERRLTGCTIARVNRRAKHVVLELDSGDRVVVQPGMTGSLLMANGRSRLDPYATIEIKLTGGRSLIHRDVRRIGSVHLMAPGDFKAYDRAVGMEPLERSFTARALGAVLARGKLAVKKAIMDQKRLAGVGNIYASEALWLAGIDPSKEARRLSTAEVKRLHAAIRGVLSRAIQGRGTTFRDYRTGTGQRGGYQERLVAYGRDGEPCRRCGRRIVMTHAIDARATYFCPGCQR